MIKSMTGYGTAHYADDQIEVTVEVKTLNSKFLDLNIRTGKFFSEKEMEIRNLVSEGLVRGKVSVNIDYQIIAGDNMAVAYNSELFKNYYNELKVLANEVGDTTQDIFRLAIQSPDVIVNASNDADLDQQWNIAKKVLNDALVQCNNFRMEEGNALGEKLLSYVDVIRKGLIKVVELDPNRLKAVRKRITENLAQFIEEEKIDKNRLEQELMFYIEKLDISEEKVRLTKHLDYYEEVLKSEASNGKKLGFISQEIGREINTIGSKANDADIQQIVVGMKEELEKIKEQGLNIL